MSQTPRLRSAFPQTPPSNARWTSYGSSPKPTTDNPSTPASSTRSPLDRTPLKTTIPPPSHENDTLIPLSVVDAPTQRFYVVALYVGLAAWRFYDCYNIRDDLDSTWLFLKWLGFDAAFFVGLPAFHIPWMEWSFFTTFTVWLLHAVANFFFMYQIPIPLGFWLSLFVKRFYDREAGLSSDRVNPALVRNNATIILGKQIIQILPEGSAILNPEHTPFCLNESTRSVELPIQINQTQPSLIELLRIDLDTFENETLSINAQQARLMKRQADKGFHKSDTKTPRVLRYQVSRTGLYQLLRVVDKSGLDVRLRSVDTAVVSCPRASISAIEPHRCAGELSNLALQVVGVPPFKVKYSKRINKQQLSSISQSIQPLDLESPLGLDEPGRILQDPSKPYLQWTQSRTVSVDINEALDKNGTWSYGIEDVEDGFGNRVNYDLEVSHAAFQSQPYFQTLTVHNRPRVVLAGCNAERPIRVAQGESAQLPFRVQPSKHFADQDWPLSLVYTFTPEDTQGTIETNAFEMSDEKSVPRIDKPGRYNIESIESQFCAGEVNEPSTCILFNPPKPDLLLGSEPVFDQCAKSPIGLRLNLDFTGTPPFKLRWVTSHQGRRTPMTKQFSGMRGQLELKEHTAGSYKYEFIDIEDDVYAPVSLKKKNLTLEQDIKPPASASFAHDSTIISACLSEERVLEVKFVGDPPWTLDYEVVHNGRRKRSSVHSDTDSYAISVPKLTEGGRQSVVLTSVGDKSGCRTPMQEERVIEVRAEKPQASFGEVNGQRSLLSLQGKQMQLPLRLKGLSPWAVTIANLDRPSEGARQHIVKDANAAIPIVEPGTYEIQSVHDSCPGTVDQTANTFLVSWIQRPAMLIKDPNVDRRDGNLYNKPPVCQGDEDTFNLVLTGNSPYTLKYQQRTEPLKGSHAVSNKELNVASSSAFINMDTSRAGQYTYTFTELSDDRYSHDKRNFKPVTVRQQVFPLPSAKFSNPGKTYGYCKGDSSGAGESIPISLDGAPPFVLEIGLTHHGTSKPEIIRIKDIPTSSFSWALSRQDLELGTHAVHIRNVADSRGCSQPFDTDPSSVRVMISDPPTIIPLESQTGYCVGEYVSFSLSGQPPFEVFYKFQGKDRKAKVPTNEFRRLAEAPGEFAITAVGDSASGKCRATKDIAKIIHPMPTVKISKGRTREDRIQEGGEVEILFEFTGTPPFEFTYTRSENSAERGKKPAVLETRNDISYAYSKSVRATDEGTYEVVSIKDKFCSYTILAAAKPGSRQKLLL